MGSSVLTHFEVKKFCYIELTLFPKVLLHFTHLHILTTYVVRTIFYVLAIYIYIYIYRILLEESIKHDSFYSYFRLDFYQWILSMEEKGHKLNNIFF